MTVTKERARTTTAPAPISAPSGRAILATDQNRRDTQLLLVGGDLLDSDQRTGATQTRIVAVDPLAPTIVEPKPKVSASGQSSSNQPSIPPPKPQSRSDGWLELRICGDLFDRSQQERIAVANIIRSPEDGGNIDPVFFAHHLAMLEATEHEAELMLGRCYRRVAPSELRAWQLATPGIGDKLFARLLGHLGDPYIATPHYWEGTGINRQLMVEDPRPRTVGQLWQYAGHGNPHLKKQRGMTAEEAFALGSPIVKMLVHLLAEACLKLDGKPDKNGKPRSRSPYRDTYDAAKTATEGRLHSTPCVRCGPSGKPAGEGSPWSDAHRHAHALRIAGKTMLRDIWLVRREALTGLPAQSSCATHEAVGGDIRLEVPT